MLLTKACRRWKL